MMLAASMGVATIDAASRSAFSGDFDVVAEGSRQLIGHVKASTFVPTEQRLVPGSFDWKGAPGRPVRESHAMFSRVDFWFDPNNPAPGLGGSNVAFAEGVECVYLTPGDAGCTEFAVMFIDDLDPSLPNQVAFSNGRDPATGDWNFDQWYWVGAGDFSLRFVAS
jgi:hypothetical protein